MACGMKVFCANQILKRWRISIEISRNNSLKILKIMD